MGIREIWEYMYTMMFVREGSYSQIAAVFEHSVLHLNFRLEVYDTCGS